MHKIRWVIITTWLWMMWAALPAQAQAPEGVSPPRTKEPSAVVGKSKEPDETQESEETSDEPRPPGFRLRQVQTVPRYDIRWRPVGHFMTDSEGLISYRRGKHFDLQYAETDLLLTFSEGYEDRLSLFYQFSPIRMDAGAGRDVHFYNAYGIWKFGLGKPVLRFGQFVIPFGNLTEYETHTTILQNLGGGGRSLGERYDRGISIEGIKDGTSYWLALTRGNSVRGNPLDEGFKVVTLRLARDLENAPFGPLRLGVSALRGKLPLFPTFADVMPTNIDPIGVTTKTRFAVDGEWDIALEKVRFEFVGGRDGRGSVNGQFLEINHPLSYQWNITLQGDRWRQFDGVAWGLGLGIEFKITDLKKIRVAYQFREGRPNGMPKETMRMLTVQYLWERPMTVFAR